MIFNCKLVHFYFSGTTVWRTNRIFDSEVRILTQILNCKNLLLVVKVGATIFADRQGIQVIGQHRALIIFFLRARAIKTRIKEYVLEFYCLDYVILSAMYASSLGLDKALKGPSIIAKNDVTIGSYQTNPEKKEI